MTGATLLVELLTEELPPKALKSLGQAFADGIYDGLQAAGLAYGAGTPEIFATPRRVGVLLPQVDAYGESRIERKKLMPLRIAFDLNDAPTPALAKRLEKEGASLDEIVKREDEVWLDRNREGVKLADGLQRALDETLAKLPIPKRMSYQRLDRNGNESTVQFVRPVHGLVALHGSDVIGVRAFAISAGRITAGHRFVGMRHVSLDSANDYVQTLRDDGKVIAGFADRRERIRTRLLAAAAGDRVVMPDALLDEVTALVEWPAVYRGTFDEAFLDVPQECLILTMQQNQKYFALTDASDRLVNRFLVVSNIETDEPSRIVEGNERVLRARLADAKFFYDQDRKCTLASRVEQLKSVVYHNKLGSQYDRMLRVEALAGRIAEMLGRDATDAQRAARLAKADLVTDMVGEFPELQGLMGRYYAKHDGEHADVAQAIEDQYKPRFSGDALPAAGVSTALALADKLETLTGLFGIGAVPTGDKDPFALRRHALGVIRMLIERELRVVLQDLLNAALDACPPNDVDRAAVFASLVDFVRVRLAGYLRDLGYSTNEIEAVLFKIDEGPLADVPKRLAAVRAFASLPEAASLAAADKRIRNILAKSEVARSHVVDATRLTADAEIALNRALVEVGAASERAYGAGDFTGALFALASLKGPVDRFFDDVMVNADDPAVRANRLALLAALHEPMNRIADLSKLVS